MCAEREEEVGEEGAVGWHCLIFFDFFPLYVPVEARGRGGGGGGFMFPGAVGWGCLCCGKLAGGC